MNKELTIDEYKEIILENLKNFDKFCRKNNIKYSLYGGTQLGSIRHGGFIPWDDDIDVVLMPEEYEKFIKLYKNEGIYKIISYESNKDYYHPFIKIIDTRLYAYEDNTKPIDELGPYIDIFRFNYIPNNKIKRKFYLLKYIIMLKIIIGLSKNEPEKGVIRKLRTKISKRINANQFIRKFDLFLRKYNKRPTDEMICNYMSLSIKNNIQKVYNFKNVNDVKFEDMIAMNANGTDAMLKVNFGDYMQLPPKEKQVGHHYIHAYWKDDLKKKGKQR